MEKEVQIPLTENNTVETVKSTDNLIVTPPSIDITSTLDILRTDSFLGLSYSIEVAKGRYELTPTFNKWLIQFFRNASYKTSPWLI